MKAGGSNADVWLEVQAELVGSAVEQRGHCRTCMGKRGVALTWNRQVFHTPNKDDQIPGFLCLIWLLETWPLLAQSLHLARHLCGHWKTNCLHPGLLLSVWPSLRGEPLRLQTLAYLNAFSLHTPRLDKSSLLHYLVKLKSTFENVSTLNSVALGQILVSAGFTSG